MKNLKKVLSVMIAIIMTMAFMTVASFAEASGGAENPGNTPGMAPGIEGITTYVPAVDENGKYYVKEVSGQDGYANENECKGHFPSIAVAEMGGNYYDSLASAYAAVLADGTGGIKTIELLKSASGPAWGEDGDAPISYVINFNGHTYNVTNDLVGSTGYETQAMRVLPGQNVVLNGGDGGTLTSDKAKMLINVYSNLTLNNMTLDGSKLVNVQSGNYTLSNNKGNIIVNDTTIVPDNDANDFAFDVWGGYNSGKTNVDVTVRGNSDIRGAFEYTATGKPGASATLRVEGGKFATDPSNHLADDKEAVMDMDGKYVVVDKGTAAASIGKKFFDSPASAYAYALKAGTSGTTTIKLLKSCSGPAWGEDNDAGLNYVVDFQGYTYTCTGPAVGSTGTKSQGFRVINGQTVTLKNGTFTSTGDSGVTMLFHVYGDLTLEDMTVDGSNMPEEGLYTISYCRGNSVIKGNTVINVVNGGRAFDVDGGYIKNHYNTENVSVTFDNNFTGTVNGTVEYTYGAAGKSTLNIGGTGDFTNANITDDSGENKAAISISGGTYSFDPRTEGYVADGHTVKENGNNTWTVESTISSDTGEPISVDIEDDIATLEPIPESDLSKAANYGKVTTINKGDLDAFAVDNNLDKVEIITGLSATQEAGSSNKAPQTRIMDGDKVIFEAVAAGGQLRVDNKRQEGGKFDTNTVDLRLQYKFTLPEGVKISDATWFWDLKYEGKTKTVSGKNYKKGDNPNEYISNVVVTGVPKAAINTDFKVNMTLSYLQNGKTYKFVQSASVPLARSLDNMLDYYGSHMPSGEEGAYVAALKAAWENSQGN